MSDLGILTMYLGIEVSPSPMVLLKVGMVDCNRVHVPMEQRLKLSKKSSNPSVNVMLY
jgi:hypothetical protein